MYTVLLLIIVKTTCINFKKTVKAIYPPPPRRLSSARPPLEEAAKTTGLEVSLRHQDKLSQRLADREEPSKSRTWDFGINPPRSSLFGQPEYLPRSVDGSLLCAFHPPLLWMMPMYLFLPCHCFLGEFC